MKKKVTKKKQVKKIDERDQIAVNVIKVINTLGEDPKNQEYCAYVAFCTLGDMIRQYSGIDSFNNYIKEIKERSQ